MSNLDEIFTRVIIKGEKKFVLGILEIFKSLKKLEIPKFFPFGPVLTSCFSLKMAKIENFSHRAIQIIAKSMPYLTRKNRITFCSVLAIFSREIKRQMIRIKIWNSYFNNAIPGHLPVRNVWFQHFPVLRLWAPKVIFLKL